MVEIWNNDTYEGHGRDGERLLYLVPSLRPLVREGNLRRQMTALPSAFFSTISAEWTVATANACFTSLLTAAAAV